MQLLVCLRVGSVAGGMERHAVLFNPEILWVLPQHSTHNPSTRDPFSLYLVRQPGLLLLHHGVVEFPADKALGGRVGGAGVAIGLPLGSAAHRHLSLRQERHNRGRGLAALLVRDAPGLSSGIYVGHS
eukprot:1144653-Pelagomonas_calceolata.AAC.6